MLCPGCNGLLPSWLLRNRVNSSACPSCYADLTIEFFPAKFRKEETVEQASLALNEGEACCYQHETKRAVSLCNRCGRFLCALCEADIDERIWCSSCLGLDGAVPAVKALESHRTLYDSIALALSTWPAILFYPCIVTAPIVFYLAIRHWKTPSSLVPRNKWRFVAALVFGLLQLGVITLLAVGIVLALKGRRT